jgi:toxin ParE1/3/4
MKHYRVSKRARKDLDEIFAYWAERASVTVAGRLVDGIIGRFWLLGQYPRCGRACENLAPGIRSFAVGRYLIYFRKARRGVEIARVLHGARDQRRAWSDRK